MTLVKNALKYEGTPIKKPNATRALLNEVDRLGTPTIIWFLVKRHKVGLLLTSNIILLTLYLFPFVPALIVSSVQ